MPPFKRLTVIALLAIASWALFAGVGYAFWKVFQ